MAEFLPHSIIWSLQTDVLARHCNVSTLQQRTDCFRGLIEQRLRFVETATVHTTVRSAGVDASTSIAQQLVLHGKASLGCRGGGGTATSIVRTAI